MEVGWGGWYGSEVGSSTVIHHAVIRGTGALSGPLYSHLRGLQMEGPRCHYLQPAAPNLGFGAHHDEEKIR